MKTTAEELMFLDFVEAQQLLDQNDPGFEIAITRSGYTIVLDENKDVAMIIAAVAA